MSLHFVDRSTSNPLRLAVTDFDHKHIMSLNAAFPVENDRACFVSEPTNDTVQRYGDGPLLL